MGSILRFRHILTPDGLERHKRLQIDDEGRISAISDESGSDFDGWLALPGMPNSHSHCFQRAMVGQGEAATGSDSFWSWREAMYGVAGTITPEELADVAARAFADMLLGGFTSVAEFHYLHHLPDGSIGTEMATAVAEGARRAGIRLVLLPVFYQSGGFGQPAFRRQSRFVHRSVEDYLMLLGDLDDPGDLALGIAPHSLRAVAPAVISELECGAREVLGDDFPRHIHVSEQRREVTECLEHFGATPVELLDDNLSLTPQWSLVHGTHATEKEIRLMADRGVTTILCPLTEAYLGDGLCDVVGLRAAGGRIAIGSDSNVRIDAVEELRMLEYGQRLRRERRACLATGDGLGRPLWNAVSAGGASATGLPVGMIRPGAFADLVVLDEKSPALAGLEDDMALDALLTAGNATDIRTVYVGGKAVVHGGLHFCEDEIGGAFVATSAALRGRL